MTAPLFLDTSSTRPGVWGRDGRSLAECAILAGKVYELAQWPIYTPGSGNEYHVPDAEQIMQMLVDLGQRALAAPEREHCTPWVSQARFLAWADDDGPHDTVVDFYITLGSSGAAPILSRPRAARSDRTPDRERDGG